MQIDLVNIWIKL